MFYWTQSDEKHIWTNASLCFPPILFQMKTCMLRGEQTHIRIEEIKCYNILSLHGCFPVWIPMTHLRDDWKSLAHEGIWNWYCGRGPKTWISSCRHCVIVRGLRETCGSNRKINPITYTKLFKFHRIQIHVFTFVPRVRWADRYHSRVCQLNMKLEPGDG